MRVIKVGASIIIDISAFLLIMITTRYYYDRLSQNDKKIYKAIYDGIMNYKPYVEVPGVNLHENTVGWIYHYVLWDNPFIFTVGEYAMWHALDGNKKRIKMTVLCDANLEKIYRKELEGTVNKILSSPKLHTLSDFQKEVFVHDFIINNVEYDHTHGNNGARIEPYTAYGALVQKKAVCEGIAKATKLLLNLLDVKCIVVSGKYEGNGHAWNIVKINDWEYNLDVTMDMGRVIHPGYMRYNYFNFRDEDMPFYKPDNSDSIPKCIAIGDSYMVKAGGYVSSYERLKSYIQNGLIKKKKVLYFKINRNAGEEYTNISTSQFQDEINRAYKDVVDKLKVNIHLFIDTTGPGEIISVEIQYL